MKRVLIDTNVLLAALIFPNGIAAQAFWKVLSDDHVVLTQWIIDEAHAVVTRKWPDRLESLERFIFSLEYDIIDSLPSGVTIRDSKDQPILDAAITGKVDIVLTGDKDFGSLTLTHPLILSPRAYLDSTS